MLSWQGTLGEADGILEDVVVKEFVDNDIPLPVVTGEVFHIPPIIVELAVSELDKLSKHVHPWVQDAIEESEEADDATYRWENYWVHKLSEITWVLGCVFELGDAQCCDHRPQIEHQNYHGR